MNKKRILYLFEVFFSDFTSSLFSFGPAPISTMARGYLYTPPAVRFKYSADFNIEKDSHAKF